jgi:hypothetical protein
MNHCTCPDCTRDRELLNSVRELLPLILAVTRAQAMASTTISNKWKEMEGETEFRRMIEKRKTEALIITSMVSSDVVK